VFVGGECEVTDHVQRVAATDCPARHDGDDWFGHRPNQALDFQNVESTGLGFLYCWIVVRGGLVVVAVLVARATPDRLVAARAEGPAAVLLGGAVARQEYAANRGLFAGMIEGCVQFVDRARAERIPNFWAVEGDADGRDVDPAVVGDVVEREGVDGLPAVGIKEFRNHTVGRDGGTKKPAETGVDRLHYRDLRCHRTEFIIGRIPNR
jgi:hypothetical protein